jgi:selenium metabolism protein YedF
MIDEAQSNPPEIIDLRGLTCPEPVLRAKKLLEDQSIHQINALVSDSINVQNLERLARSHKLGFKWQAEEDFFRVVLSRVGKDKVARSSNQKEESVHLHESASANLVDLQAKGGQVGTVIFITKSRLGDGDPDFGANLLNIFLQTILQSGHRPKAILLVNSGVSLLAENSPFEPVLKNFKNEGAEVLACGLCVEFYGLEKDIAKEQITNMFAICEYLFAADKVISP